VLLATAATMTCPFCTKKVHPDALLDLADEHRKIHEVWNLSFVRAVCPSNSRRNTLRTTIKYGSQLGFLLDDAYRALNGKEKRQNNTPIVYRLVRFLLDAGKLPEQTNAFELITSKMFMNCLSRARVDRYKNKSGQTVTAWHTMELVRNKRSDKRMPDSLMTRMVDSKNTVRSPLTHYTRVRALIATATGIEKELIIFPSLLCKSAACKQMAALRKATPSNLLNAAYNRKRKLDVAVEPVKRARITGLLNMPEFNDVECVVKVKGALCTCLLPSGDLVDIARHHLIF